MIDFCLVVSVHGRRCIEQGRKQIFANVLHLGCVLPQAVQYILDVEIVQLQESASNDFRWIAAAGDQDLISGAYYCLQDQIRDTANPLALDSVSFLKSPIVLI